MKVKVEIYVQLDQSKRSLEEFKDDLEQVLTTDLYYDDIVSVDDFTVTEVKE